MKQLAFALGNGNGRIGVLAVQGRKVGLNVLLLNDCPWLPTTRCTSRCSSHLAHLSSCCRRPVCRCLAGDHVAQSCGIGVVQVTDTKPRRPTAGIMDVSIAVAAWGTLVVFGDSEGDHSYLQSQVFAAFGLGCFQPLIDSLAALGILYGTGP
jgi:hypothetical protein